MPRPPDDQPVGQGGRPNWHRLAFSRNADPSAKRRARKIVLILEGGYLVVAVTLRFTLPSLSWLGVALLWLAAVMVAGTLIWLMSSDQRHR